MRFKPVDRVVFVKNLSTDVNLSPWQQRCLEYKTVIVVSNVLSGSIQFPVRCDSIDGAYNGVFKEEELIFEHELKGYKPPKPLKSWTLKGV